MRNIEEGQCSWSPIGYRTKGVKGPSHPIGQEEGEG